MRTLVVDAYDSFVHIIATYFAELDAGPVVLRHDEVTPAVIEELAPDAVVLGPGPGHPSEVGYVDVIRQVAGRLPVLGVCLGHQAISLAYGGAVVQADHLVHGKTSVLDHDGRGVFRDAPVDFTVTRYHSLVVADLPPELEVSARSRDDGYVMGMRHVDLPIESVQFHPESIGTRGGRAVFASFLTQHVAARATAP